MDSPSTLDADPPPPPTPLRTDGRSRARSWLRAFGIVALATAGMWAICATALVIYTNGARAPELHVLEIPAGTGQRIAAGENPLDIPSSWGFQADDTLRLVNHDDVTHSIGAFSVPAFATTEYPLRANLGGSLFCSVHPSRAVEFRIETRDFDWRLTVFPTVALGPVVGLIVVGVGRVVRHLDEEPLHDR